MGIQLKPVPRLHGPNPPGLALIIVLFADQIISMPEFFPDGQLSQDPVLIEGTEPLVFYVGDLEAEHEEDARRRPEGMQYEQQLEFMYAAPEAEGDATFRQFFNRDFVLICTNLRGQRKCIGTKEHPLQCRIQKSTGGQSGMYGYRISFAGTTLFPVPDFTGQLASGELPPPPAESQMFDFSAADFSNTDFY